MNISYVNWYLVELRRRLHDSMPLDQENSFILETKNHLESLSQDLMSQGMEARQAEIAAIERFGTPDSVASRCLLSIRSHRERKFLFACTCLLGAFILFFCYSWVNSTWNAATSMEIMTPLIVALALYALIMGRMPSARWFVLPLPLILGFGLFAAKSQTFTAFLPGTYYQQWVSYDRLHSQYGQLKTQNENAAKIEHEAAEKWRDVTRNAKDLGIKDSLSIPRITYAVQSNAQSDYRRLRSYGYGEYLSNAPEYIALSTTTGDKANFQFMPVAGSLDLKGPLTAQDVRKAINGRLSEVQQRAKSRDKFMAVYAKGLNMGVFDRWETKVEYRSQLYFFTFLPFSLIACYLTSRVRNRIRFKPNKLRLA